MEGRATRAARARYLTDARQRSEAKRQAAKQPAYIQACFLNPDRKKTYWVYTWKPHEPDAKKRIPYQCGSWRCEHCQPHAGHVLFARLQEAFTGLRSSGVVFMVLTLDPQLHRAAAHSLDDIYRDFARRQNRFMKRLRRYLEVRFGSDMGNRWASVTECHKSGVPHVNIAIYHPEWAAELTQDRGHRLNAGAGEFDSVRLSLALQAHAQDCGFGWRCTAEANRYGDTEAISGYLVKGVKRADRMHSEIAKLSQLPLMAPKNFRRLRAGKGFVPPKRKGECTGTVIRRYRSPEGDEQTEPLSKPKLRPEPERVLNEDAWQEWNSETQRKLAYMREVAHCARIEQELAYLNESEPPRDVNRTRESLVTAYRRREDGATVSSGVVVLDAPKPRKEEHHEKAERDRRNGTGAQRSRDAPGKEAGGRISESSRSSFGGRVSDQRLRAAETAQSAEQLSFGAGIGMGTARR